MILRKDQDPPRSGHIPWFRLAVVAEARPAQGSRRRREVDRTCDSLVARKFLARHRIRGKPLDLARARGEPRTFDG
ncbi:MAG: hypothetical protein IPK67_10280 [Planctomycetes bacterium]|nr:hypothetical protein [Planctomycetota bacterium]